jgi:hypothetical protein
MGGNSTLEQLFNLNDLRVELLQSAARALFFGSQWETGNCFAALSVA